MPRYRYDAVDDRGLPQQGEVQAASQDAALADLCARGLMIRHLQMVTESLDVTDFVSEGQATAPARRPLDALTSLRALSEEISGGRAQRGLRELIDRIERGEAPERALADVASRLPSMLHRLIEVGLARDRLDWFLEHYVEANRRASDARHKVMMSLGYPSMLLVIVFLLSGLFLGLIVPTFRRIFEDFGTELPQLTLFIVSVSDFVISTPCLVIGAVPIFTAIALGIWSIANGPQATRFVLGRIPVIGAAIRCASRGNACELLRLQIETGFAIPEALDVLAEVTDDLSVASSAPLLAETLRQGVSRPTRADMRRVGWPEDLMDAFPWADRRDAFISALRGMTDILVARSRVQSNLAGWLLNPLVMFVVAVSVGVVVLSLFMPLIKLLNDLS